MAIETQTILIVEDEAPLRKVLAATLQQSGFTVLEAGNGKEGLETALKQHPALILSDNLMPLMNGVDMMAEVRKDSWGKTVPAIIMTNMYSVDAVNQSLEAGVTDYIMKTDVSIDKIVELVKSKLA
ncbi:MAG: response regulator [Candidatus Saccharimonadales bacterium]